MIRHQLIDPSTPLFAPLVVLDYGTICIGVMLYAPKLGAPAQMNSLQGLFWYFTENVVRLCWHAKHPLGRISSYHLSFAVL
jgi:hypothetical protein